MTVADAADLALLLASPVRLGVVAHLAEHPTARVSELAEVLKLSESQLSNHLRRLRDANIVAVERVGKAATYSLISQHAREVTAALLGGYQLTGPPNLSPDSLRYARSCYNHLAGQVGVQICTALMRRDVIRRVDDLGNLELGEGAEDTLVALGVGLSGLHHPRRRFAYLCPDWTHASSHLGGSLGAAILLSLLQREYFIAVADSRVLRLTESGREALTGLGLFSTCDGSAARR